LSPDTNERIALRLRERGRDAHTFTVTSHRYCRRESGEAIHGVCVLGWRYPGGRCEFVDRPAWLVEPDERDPAQRWEQITSWSGARQQLSLIVTDQPDVVCARLAELLPVDPEKPHARCFPDLWTWERTGWCSGGASHQWDQAWVKHLRLPLARSRASVAGQTDRNGVGR
jgi:hypothetical protein